MPDESAAGAHENILTKRIGPFKGYVYVAIVGVPVVAFILFKKGSGGGAATPTPSGIPGYDPGAVTGGGGSSGGGGGTPAAPFDPTSLIAAIDKSGANSLAAITAMENANAQAAGAAAAQNSSNFATLFGSLTQALASLRNGPTLTQPSAPAQPATPYNYTPPVINQPKAPQSLPPSYAPAPFLGYGMPQSPVGSYVPSNPSSWPYGSYTPGGGYTPLPTPGGLPLPGYGATTYFGGNGTIIHGGVPR